MRSKLSLTFDDAHKALDAARRLAATRGWNVSVAVVDDGGHALLAARLDGAAPATLDAALAKACTAARMRRPTAALEERVKSGRVAMIGMPGILALEGGIPIEAGGECVGAVGVSGVRSEQDAELAIAAIAALLDGHS